MKLSINKLIILIFPLFAITFLAYSPFDNDVIYILYIAIVLLDLFKSKGLLYCTKQCQSLYFCVIIGFFIVPIVAFKVRSLQSLLYVLLLIVFLRTCELIGREWQDSEDQSFGISCVLTTIIVDYHVILNIDEINSETILGVFYQSEQGILRVRGSFGYAHPNTAAIMLVAVILMLYIMQTSMNKIKNKVIVALSILFNFIALLCTGSRTGAVSVLCFFFLLLYFFAYSKLNKPHLQFVALFITAVLIIAAITTASWQTIAEMSSGRDVLLKDGLSEMTSNGTLFFGEQVASITQSTSSGITVSGTDNWYYMTLLHFGLFGMFMFLIPFIVLSVKATKRAMRGEIPIYIPAAVLMLCVYGIGENVVFNQGIILSCLVISLFFKSMYYKQNTLCDTVRKTKSQQYMYAHKSRR